jgi:hypothetical protein
MGAIDASIKSLDLGEVDFFRQLDKDAVIIKEDTKAEANIIHGFNGYRSIVMPWLRRTGIKEHTRGLKKNEIHVSFLAPRNTNDEPELFLMLEVIDEIFLEAYS